MPDAALLGLVVDRIETHSPAHGAADLILAAFHGSDAVDAALRGEAPGALISVAQSVVAAPAAVYLAAIEVEGFRGIGPPTTLHIDPGPGLTLVVGRNGSGKSSFSEALEMVLLGTNQRWEQRVKVWRDGWQNLHHRHSRVSAQFTVDGRRQPLDVGRVWKEGDGVDGSTLIVDGKPASPDSLGWAQQLAGYPPLLSHNELEHALDREQSKLYDALAGILGLGDLAAAQQVLQRARLSREHDAKEARDALPALRALLDRTSDERAAVVRAALSSKTWDLDVVASTVGGDAQSDERSVLRKLRDLAGLPVLDRERLNAVTTELREVHAAAERLRGTDAGRAHEVASLLQQALDVHAHAEGERCPVCGTEGVLTYQWRVQARDEVLRLRADAEAVRKARDMLGDAIRQARQLVTAPLKTLRDGAGASVDVAPVIALWERWADVAADDDAIALAGHLETHGTPLIAAVADLRRAASAELERLERAWRPAAEAIALWLPMGRRALEAEREAGCLKESERWLKDAHDELRDERFRPIAGAVQENWTALRQDSNVSLGDLRLLGASNQRRLALDVKVDGEDGSALGVMSQGELNCLALSLFLPRASMPESPFRFVVIDDPVQAMDPAKVAGLATVLARAAKDRQVIVLTHDTRLADAMSALDINATVIEVVRREQSIVELRRIQDPVQRYIEDAFAVAMSRDVPAEALRVIPGFCRLALEAAASLAATRRLLHQGRTYADVQHVLAQPTTLNMWLALALLNDPERSGDVTGFLQKQYPWAVEAVRECNRGTHSGKLFGDVKEFIRSIEQLTKKILER
ncbi:MAG: AAA family ATPase [Candidatus Dormiibacterota bacterium]